MRHINQKILIVDDRPENLVVLEALLEPLDVDVVRAQSGNEALGFMLDSDFAMVLLDVQMPEMDGFETAKIMHSIDRSKHIPVIFVTAISKEDNFILHGYENGAVDYLFKPLNPYVLQSKVKVFLNLDRQKKELQLAKQIIEEQNKALSKLAITDGLTGLINRRHFQELLDREIKLTNRYDRNLSLLMLDLDHFKDINDTCGHQYGDYVLKEFSGLVEGVLRQTDIFARYGGEEFMVVLPNTDMSGGSVMAEKIRKETLAHRFEQGGIISRVTVSIGIASYDNLDDCNAEKFVNHTDKALYHAKNSGRNQVVGFCDIACQADKQKIKEKNNG